MLNNYVVKYNPKYYIRMFDKDFCFNNIIILVLLYVVFWINADVLDKKLL